MKKNVLLHIVAKIKKKKINKKATFFHVKMSKLDHQLVIQELLIQKHLVYMKKTQVDEYILMFIFSI